MSSKIAVYELVDVLTAYVVLLPFSLYHNQFYNQEIHIQAKRVTSFSGIW